MSDITPEIAADVVAAATENAEEAAGALSRALDQEIGIQVGEAAAWDPESPSAGLDGPGLAVVMTFGEQGVAAVLPQASGLLPDWVQTPDPTGESKLATLAQELSMLLVPDTLMADQFEAAWVDNLADAIESSGLAATAAVVPIQLTAGDNAGTLTMLWPLATAGAMLASSPAEEETPAEAPAAEPQPAAPARLPRIFDYSQLPAYSRSLLKVKVPVSVTLAGKKQKVEEVMALGPGSILTFDRSCDEPIDVYVGNRPVAMGEAVKVGEKFGVKIREIVMPPEHFGKATR